MRHRGPATLLATLCLALAPGAATSSTQKDSEAATPPGPLLDALAYVPGGDVTVIGFSDWAGLKAQHGGAGVTSDSPLADRQALLLEIAASAANTTSLDVDRLAMWSTAWGWDSTDLAWQMSLASAPLEPAPLEPAPLEPAPLEPAPLEPAPLEPAPLEPAPLEPAPLEPAPLEPAPLASAPLAATLQPATTILHFRDDWDAEPFKVQLERHGFVRREAPGLATYSPGPGAWYDAGGELDRLLGPISTGPAIDSTAASPRQPSIGLSLIDDGRTVILQSGGTGRELAELATTSDARAVAESPFGRVARNLGAPLVARIASGEVGCSGTGAENGLLRGEAARLAASVGRLRPYQAFGVAYGRATQGTNGDADDDANEGARPTGRHVFEYERAREAERDLEGRRTLIEAGTAFTLEAADVIGQGIVLTMSSQTEPPQALFDRRAGLALATICGPPPSDVTPPRRPVADVPIFAGPATLALSGGHGIYAWDEAHFGADEVRVSATVTAGHDPCSVNLLARRDGLEEGGRVASEGFSVAPAETTTHRTEVGVDYTTASLRIDSTCPRWSLRFEPRQDPNLALTLEDRFYPVRGDTFAELVPQTYHVMDRWAAFARWQTDWQFEWLDSGGSCDVTSGSASVEASIIFPRWQQPADADPAGVVRWERFMEGLTTHELGHITIALQGADAVDELLDNGFSAPSCPEAERLANRAASRLHERYDLLNRRYDAETDHGGTQGTSSP